MAFRKDLYSAWTRMGKQVHIATAPKSLVLRRLVVTLAPCGGLANGLFAQKAVGKVSRKGLYTVSLKLGYSYPETTVQTRGSPKNWISALFKPARDLLRLAWTPEGTVEMVCRTVLLRNLLIYGCCHLCVSGDLPCALWFNRRQWLMRLQMYMTGKAEIKMLSFSRWIEVPHDLSWKDIDQNSRRSFVIWL